MKKTPHLRDLGPKFALLWRGSANSGDIFRKSAHESTNHSQSNTIVTTPREASPMRESQC